MSNTVRGPNGLITVTPKDESKVSALMIICHGLGDSAEGFVDVAENLTREIPYLKFILPTAPTRPVTMNMGMPMPAWYDITGLDERSNENSPGLEDSVKVIHDILESEHKTTGLPYSRMMLGGFSMGGALSLFSGLSLPNKSMKLSGIVCLSGYLVAAKKLKVTPGLEDTPILHCHGTADPLVIYANALKSKEHLKEKGVTDYVLKGYPGVQHTVIPEEIREWISFCQRVLPPDETFRVKLKDPSEMSVKELKAAIRNAGLSHKAVGLMEKSEFVKLLTEYRNSLS